MKTQYRLSNGHSLPTHAFSLRGEFIVRLEYSVVVMRGRAIVEDMICLSLNRGIAEGVRGCKYQNVQKERSACDRGL